MSAKKILILSIINITFLVKFCKIFCKTETFNKISGIILRESYTKPFWGIYVLPIEKPIVTLKISVTNFCRFQCFENFDIKLLLLDQNVFEKIVFC